MGLLYLRHLYSKCITYESLNNYIQSIWGCCCCDRILICLIRAHKIAYRFGGPSEKNVSPH